ncbi:MAG: hypothetical protein ACOZQL_30115 [Myxococcota bacterium]
MLRGGELLVAPAAPRELERLSGRVALGDCRHPGLAARGELFAEARRVARLQRLSQRVSLSRHLGEGLLRPGERVGVAFRRRLRRSPALLERLPGRVTLGERREVGLPARGQLVTQHRDVVGRCRLERLSGRVTLGDRREVCLPARGQLVAQHRDVVGRCGLERLSGRVTLSGHLGERLLGEGELRTHGVGVRGALR